MTLDLRRGHPLSGPIAVRGAEPATCQGRVPRGRDRRLRLDRGHPGLRAARRSLFEEPFLVTWARRAGSRPPRGGRAHPHQPVVGVIAGRASARATGALPRARGGAGGGRRVALHRGGARALRTIPPRRAATSTSRGACRRGLPASIGRLARRRPLRAGEAEAAHRDRDARPRHAARRRAARREAFGFGRRPRPSRSGASP